MKAVISILAPLAALISACSQPQAQGAMQRELFEPATAHYSLFLAPAGRQRKAPPVICGLVDAKNHHGFVTTGQRYLVDRRTGQATFQNDLILDRPLYPTRGDWPREARFLSNWDAVCRAGALTYPQVRKTFDWHRSPAPSEWDWTFSNGMREK